MAGRDPAFLWETELLREAKAGEPRAARHDEADWLTVKEASEASGIPESTIRKWARHHDLPSFLEETSTGHLRMVSISAIRRRAEWLGRAVADEPPHEIAAETPAPDVPEGSMLVPLDAWNRLLNQLGNLHEAGQQLAEARERAARAETEATFLRERLAELRGEMERARSAEASTEVPQSRSGQTGLARRVYRAWRAGRRSSS